jgi:Family of unknown function (DUF5995)
MDMMTRSAAEVRLAALATDWSAAHDQRAVFADCYRVMTERMSDGVAAGTFEDGVWVARLRDRFAEYYFDALDGYAAADRDAVCPEVWRIALDPCARPAACSGPPTSGSSARSSPGGVAGCGPTRCPCSPSRRRARQRGTGHRRPGPAARRSPGPRARLRRVVLQQDADDGPRMVSGAAASAGSQSTS